MTAYHANHFAGLEQVKECALESRLVPSQFVQDVSKSVLMPGATAVAAESLDKSVLMPQATAVAAKRVAKSVRAPEAAAVPAVCVGGGRLVEL